MAKNFVSDDEKRKARRVVLYDFLINHHADIHIMDKGSLRLATNHAVSIPPGCTWFKNFSTGESGNSIDYLVKYLGYNFIDAVCALLEKGCTVVSKDSIQNNISKEKPAFERPKAGINNDKVIQYLHVERRIPLNLIQWLIVNHLLYQDDHNNCVFIQNNHAEIRGTGLMSFKKFPRGDVASIWWYKEYDFGDDLSKVKHVFITESAIDALSLSLLIKDNDSGMFDFRGQNIYGSLGGVGKQILVEQAKRMFGADKIVIAFDNDTAGQKAAEKHDDCDIIFPTRKDWNEDLIYLRLLQEKSHQP